MRRLIVVLHLMTAFAWSHGAIAQSGSVQVSQTFTVPAGGSILDVEVRCPLGYRLGNTEITYIGAKPTAATFEIIDQYGQRYRTDRIDADTDSVGVRARLTNDRPVAVDGT